jgi:sugar transferase (PEP-CTERM/EpsH1 system associated)
MVFAGHTQLMADKPPLILHVIHHLYMGGMENGLINLINHMPAVKYRHAILCVEDYSDFRNRITRPGVDVIALYRSRIGVWKLRREIYRLCRRMRPAIVHSRNLSGLDALLPARLAGVPHCVHGEHGWDVHDLEGRHWRPMLLRRLHSPLIEHHITVSRDLQHYLTTRAGIRDARITQIYNGVDTQRFQPDPAKPRDWLPPAFRDASLTLIGTVGRIQPVKDQATLLEAFARMLAQAPALRQTLRLLIVGDGPLLDDLKALAGRLQIAELTCFMGALADVPQALRALDVYVLPSLNEGISNTILEAMACGLPVVATGVGGNLELVDDGVCGRLFTPRDVPALSELLLQYVRDVPLREAHSSAARHIAVERYSLAAMVARYTATYDRLCRRATA